MPLALRLVPFAFVLLAAFLATRTTSVFFESALLPLPEARPVIARTPSPSRTLDLDTLRRTLGFPKPLPQDPPPASDEPTRSALPLTLLGTLISQTRPDWSVASLHDTTTRKTNTFMRGDRVLGAELLAIERNRVLILNAGRREFIDTSAAATSSPITSRIRQLDEHTTQLPRAELEGALSDLALLSSQARIVPAFKDGLTVGFKLFSIRPDSLYAKLGVQNGDVIKRIDGLELTTLERGLELLSRVRQARRVEVELERAGATLRKTVTLD